MIPNELLQILEKLGGINARLEDQGKTIRQILDEARKTNGRVTAIEAKEGEIDAVEAERRRVAAVRTAHRQRWNGWFQPVITGVVMIVVAAALAALLNLDKL